MDGGFSFALAAFAIGLGLIAVLERIGLPDRALRFCVGAMIFFGFVIIAALLRTMRPVDFYAGGRSLPSAYAGLAYAGLATGLFLPFLPPLPQGIGFASVATGFGVGLCCALFTTGPHLRRRGAFSIADLVGSYFPHPIARCAIAAIAAFCAMLVAIAGYESALHAFVAGTGVSRAVAAVILGVLLVFLTVPGGLSGAIWLAVGAAVVTLTALGLPPVLSILHESTPWTAGLARFHDVTASPPSGPLQLEAVVALALGLCALAPLFGPAVASRDGRTALRSGPLAFVFMAIVAFLATQTFANATLALDATMVGHAPSKLPIEILAASEDGGITICGVQSAVASVLDGTCANADGFNGVLRSGDIGARAGYLLESLPTLRRAGPMLAGLADVFAIVLGLGVAAAGVQSFATSLGHDIFHPSRRRFGPITRRLACARALAILLIAFCGAYLGTRSVDPRVFVTLALTISATLVAPVLGLTLLKRATSFDALAAMLVAALVMGRFILAHPTSWPPDALAATAILAAFDGFVAGALLSLLHGRSLLPARPSPPDANEPLGPD